MDGCFWFLVLNCSEDPLQSIYNRIRCQLPKINRIKNFPIALRHSTSHVIFDTWVSHCLPYLGVQLTTSVADLFAANFPPLLKQVTELITQWSSLPLSWMGRINVIKMSILPKFLSLEDYPSPSHLTSSLKRRVIAYVWGNIKFLKPTLYLPKLSCGSGLPNF